MFSLKQVKYKDILSIHNLDIKANKITCILGQSGSGKTTLLKLLNKLISHDEGTIYYKGESLEDSDAVQLRRKVVMLPQTPAIFSGSVKDNLLIGLEYSERPIESEDKLKEVLKIVQLKKELAQSAERLSGGEKQRVALARILLMHPEVLLLDEPSSALDQETEEIIIKSLVDYTKSNNKTLIMVTHSKHIAHQFADEIIDLKNGEVNLEEEEQDGRDY